MKTFHQWLEQGSQEELERYRYEKNDPIELLQLRKDLAAHAAKQELEKSRQPKPLPVKDAVSKVKDLIESLREMLRNQSSTEEKQQLVADIEQTIKQAGMESIPTIKKLLSRFSFTMDLAGAWPERTTAFLDEFLHEISKEGRRMQRARQLHPGTEYPFNPHLDPYRWH